MAPFDHYMYVLRCGDGSLYTGYTPDVAARLAAHQAGRGARYTKSHEPVELVAQARFYSKERAMSAEALFKRLSRGEKDALLAEAAAASGVVDSAEAAAASGKAAGISAGQAFADVLRRELPGFGDDTAREFVRRSLAAHVDPAYRSFMVKLVPNVNPARVVGVRTPDLRRIARDLARRSDARDFLRALPHQLFEENQVHALALGRERDYRRALASYEDFLPHVDNWATCDQLPTKPLASRPDQTLERARAWLASGAPYVIRFGIGTLMHLYLGELFDPRMLQMVADVRFPADAGAGTGEKPAPASDAYYVHMMRAWYFAEALAQQEEATLPYLELRGARALLDEWTRRKAIQKAIESRRISPQMKDHLRACRR